MDKVRLTQEDIANGNINRANERMNTGDGGLAKHNSTCEKTIDWNNAKIIGRETKTRAWSKIKLHLRIYDFAKTLIT